MLSSALVTLLVLGAGPHASATRAHARAADPELEIVIPERMLEEFLVAAAPFERTITRDVGVLGLTRTVSLDLTLTKPKVKVTPAGIQVTLDYWIRGPGGISSKGQATPTLQLRAVDGKGLLEGKLTGARLSAAGGIELQMDDLLEPIQFPVAVMGPIPVGDSVIDAQTVARDVILEDGKVRVKGAWEFKKPKTRSAEAVP